jgi:hypothetical protein
VALAWIDEVLFAATVLLIPGVIALYRALDGSNRAWVGFGCGTLAATIPTLFAVLIVHGRLAFPVYGMRVDDPTTITLLVSLYYGGLNPVNLLFAGACIVLGLSMRRGVFGSVAGMVGVAAGATQLVVAYPWLVDPGIILVFQAILAAWLLLSGWRMAQPSIPSTTAPRAP